MGKYLQAKNGSDEEYTNELYQKLLTMQWESPSDPNIKPINIDNVGHSGGDTFFRFDDNVDSSISFGGKGGTTYKDNTEEYNIDDASGSDETKEDFYIEGSSYIIAGNQGASSNAGTGGAGGDCLDASGASNANYCVGNSPIVLACSKNNKETGCQDGFSKSFHFGAGGGGGAFRISPNEQSAPVKFPGGSGAGGAVVIEWN